MSSPDITLVLFNANVLTMRRVQPRAEAVAVAGGRIAAVGGNGEILRFDQNDRMASAHAEVIDCQGMTLLPGFNDAHCHLPGLARRLQDPRLRAGIRAGDSGVASVASATGRVAPGGKLGARVRLR